MQNQKNGHNATWGALTASSLAPVWLACQSLGLGLAGAIIPLSVQQQAVAALLTNWQFDPATNQLEFTLPEGATPRYSVLEQPTRILIEIPDTQVGTDTTQLYPTGIVRSIRLSEFRPGLTRIAIDFAPEVVLTSQQVELQRVASENRWVLRPLLTTTTPPASTALPQQSATVSPPPENVVAPQQSATVSPPSLPPESAAAFNAPPSPTVPAPPLPLQSEPIRPVTVQLRAPIAETRLAPNPRQPVNLPPSIPRARPVVPTAPLAVAQGRVQPFGTPLPRQPLPPIASEFDAVGGFAPAILLPAGSILNLFYPGPESLRLEPKPDRQEVLVLLDGIRDSSGNFVVPPNTPVLGHFETNNDGSRFVAEALYLQDRTVPLAAKSERISGGQPKPSTRSLIRNSGIGGLAVFLLSGLSGFGLLAGAAAGIGATYGTAPQPATIPAGQVFPVQLTDDFLTPSSL